MAKVTVRVWASLSALFGEPQTRTRSIEVEVAEAETVETLLRRLAARYPRFGPVAFDPGPDGPGTGPPSDQVTVVVNDSLPELLDGYSTRLRDGDRVVLVQAYAGG